MESQDYTHLVVLECRWGPSSMAKVARRHSMMSLVALACRQLVTERPTKQTRGDNQSAPVKPARVRDPGTPIDNR